MIGLALEGGGAKGAYQVGVLKALKELKVDIDVVAGTSIGAINGAVFASGQLEKLEQIWLTSDIGAFINADPEALARMVRYEPSVKTLEFIIDTVKEGGFDISPLREQLSVLIDEEKIRSGDITFGLVTYVVNQLKSLELFIDDIPKGQLLDYVIASACLPVFKKETIDGNLMIDGGFYDNLPVNMLLAHGCDKVIAVRVHGIGVIRRVKSKDKKKVEYIQNSKHLGGTLEIVKEQAAKNIRLGYLDTLKHYGNLYGHRFFLTSKVPASFVECPLDIHVNKILRDLLHISGDKDIYQEIATILGQKSYHGKVDTYTALIEYLASQAEIEDTYSYSFSALYEAVCSFYGAMRDQIWDSGVSLAEAFQTSIFFGEDKKKLLIQLFYVLNDYYQSCTMED